MPKPAAKRTAKSTAEPAAQVKIAKAAASAAKPVARPPAKALQAAAPDHPRSRAHPRRRRGRARVVADEATSEALDKSYQLHLIDPVHRETIEQLSLNLARAALTAQGAIAEAALRHADRPAALTPDPFHVAPALSEVMARLAASPTG